MIVAVSLGLDLLALGVTAAAVVIEEAPKAYKAYKVLSKAKELEKEETKKVSHK